MAPLALTLALLAMTVATVANKVIPLDMAQGSFDDQYQGCRPAMTAALPALNSSEFQQNRVYAQVWGKAVELQSQGPPESPLFSDKATAILAFTIDDLHSEFNDAVRKAGRSPQEYRDNFHYKTLHFLLTDALATLRDAQKGQCLNIFCQVCGVRFEAQRGDTIRFGQFMPMDQTKNRFQCHMNETLFHVHTCYGKEMQSFFKYPEHEWVLIPPFETFEVTKVTREGDKAQIQLHSTGTYSKYNCEWLKGGSVPSAPFHLGGLLLATTTLAVAAGIF